ncbi:mCG144839, partial [Mus musculus]
FLLPSMAWRRCPFKTVRHIVCSRMPFMAILDLCQSRHLLQKRSFFDKGESIIHLRYQKKKYCSLICQ